MKMIFFMIMLICFASMLVTTIKSSFPNSLKHELTLSQSNFSTNNWIVFLKLSNYLILLIRWQFSQLLQNFALILTLKRKFFIFRSPSLRCFLTWVISLGHKFKITHIVFDAHISTQPIHLSLLHNLSFIFVNILSRHIILICFFAFQSK